MKELQPSCISTGVTWVTFPSAERSKNRRTLRQCCTSSIVLEPQKTLGKMGISRVMALSMQVWAASWGAVIRVKMKAARVMWGWLTD